jgi:hypothetical protein
VIERPRFGLDVHAQLAIRVGGLSREWLVLEGAQARFTGMSSVNAQHQGGSLLRLVVHPPEVSGHGAVPQ